MVTPEPEVLTTVPDPLRWHQAVAYALTGRRYVELGEQDRPDLDAVTAFLRSRPASELDPATLHQAHPLPVDLAAGLGPAQLWTLVAELRSRLRGPRASPVTRSRPLGADERRLLQDVPPHHEA